MAYTERLIPASASARLAAFLIDLIATGVMVMVAMGWSSGTTDLAAFIAQTHYGELGIVLGTPLIIQLVAVGLTDGTIGMWLTELRIIQAAGEPLEWGNIIRRPFGLLLLPLSVACLGLIPLLSEHRRTLGDYVSGSRVVEKPVRGEKISYDPWRVFKGLLRPLAPVSLAVALAALLLNKSAGQPNHLVLMDAVVIAATWTLIIVTLATVLIVKTSRVRIDATGVYRGSLFGWSRKGVRWQEIDHARIIPRRLLNHFEVHKTNRRRFKIPLEYNLGRLMAEEFGRHGIRIEP